MVRGAPRQPQLEDGGGGDIDMRRLWKTQLKANVIQRDGTGGVRESWTQPTRCCLTTVSLRVPGRTKQVSFASGFHSSMRKIDSLSQRLKETYWLTYVS